MNWLDVLVIMILVAAVIIEALRGFGRAVFDALALYGVLWLASMGAAPFAKILPLSSNPSVALAFAYSIIAVAGGVIGLILAHYAYATMLLHAGMFDHFLGLALGVAVGMMFSHALVKTIALSDPSGDGSGALVATGTVSSEMYDFHNYHSIVDGITGAANYHREINLGNEKK
jgi:uncharacterized membrane protein required for colicin V production